MTEPKQWVIFQIVIGNVTSWQLSTRKLTASEAERVRSKSNFEFDFSRDGLDLSGGLHMITGAYFVRGPKKVALEMENALNDLGVEGLLRRMKKGAKDGIAEKAEEEV